MNSGRLIGVSSMAHVRRLDTSMGVALTFVEAALVWIQQRTNVLVDDA